jgi:PGF-CTERM protein
MNGKICVVITIVLLVSLLIGNLTGIVASTELNPEEINWEGIFIQYYKDYEIRFIPELGIYTIDEDWYSDNVEDMKKIIDFGEEGVLDDPEAWEYAETKSYKGHYINRYWITGTFEGKTHSRSFWCSMEDLEMCCTDMSIIKKFIDLLATPTPTPVSTPRAISTPMPVTPTPAQQDSDGDGVPDEYDYAPYDPEVQTKSDVKTPGFGAIFAIAGLLAVVYLLRRRE